MYYVYILRSKLSGTYYIGSTNKYEDRIKRHNNGESKYTKRGRPWILVHLETFLTLEESRARERKIKSYKGGNAFKRLVSGEVA